MQFTIVRDGPSKCVVCSGSIGSVYIKAYSPDSEITRYICAHCSDNIINLYNSKA